MAKKKARKQRRKHGLGWFIFGMVVYAAVFLGATAYGLKQLWVYMEHYEASREYLAIDAYMEQLTVDHICNSSADLIAQVDHNIQSVEECYQVIKDALSEEITYARKASECTETKQVYVLRSGDLVIGSFAITTTEADEYGFTPWEQTEESFDLSFLLGESVSTTAPAGYPVYVNGVQLDSSYVTAEQTVEYEVLEEFYGDYDLPLFTTQTYEAGPFLGNFPMEVTDPEGNPFVFDDSFDKNILINNCSEAEIEDLDAFVEEFIKRYVAFTGSANRARFENYDRVAELVVEGSSFLQRMYDAIEGLYFAQSRGDEIDSIITHHRVKIEDGRYMCDVTYLVNTTGMEGVVQTTNNIKLIIVEQNGELLVETVTTY